MGAEVGTWNEWDCKGQIDWFLLQYPLHQGLFEMIRDLNHFYLKYPVLWEDSDWKGYEWIDFSDYERSVISYLRKGNGKTLACVHNFTPELYLNYCISLPKVKKIKEVFNTDAVQYGGSNQLNQAIQKDPGHLTLTLSPLATMIFEVEFD